VFVSTRSEELSQFEQVYVGGVGKRSAAVPRVAAAALSREQVRFGRLGVELPLAVPGVSLVDVEYGADELAQVARIGGGLPQGVWFRPVGS